MDKTNPATSIPTTYYLITHSLYPITSNHQPVTNHPYD